MNYGAQTWVIIVLALLAANAPFFTPRLFGLIPLARAKTPAWCLLELLLAYALVGLVAYFLERAGGRVVTQGWEFYAVTGALFLALAFPGFVYRYLVHR